MKDYTNSTIVALCEKLREWSGFNGNDFSELLEEAADRLELLDIENTDLLIALSREKQDSNFWQQKATEAMNRIRRLEEAGDALCTVAAYTGWCDRIDAWTKAKESKP